MRLIYFPSYRNLELPRSTDGGHGQGASLCLCMWPTERCNHLIVLFAEQRSAELGLLWACAHVLVSVAAVVVMGLHSGFFPGRMIDWGDSDMLV